MADMDLHTANAIWCLRCVLPEESFHSSGSFSFLFKNLPSAALVVSSLPFAADLVKTAMVLIVDSIVAAYLLYAHITG